MKPVRLFLTICCLLFLSGLGACTSPELLDTGQSISIARIDDKTYVTSDGEKLAMSAWQARAPEAVYVAVHGFNEYAADFRLPAPWFAERGISVYGYDQRGFGRTPDSRRGKWAGGDVMASDLTTFVRLIRQRHPGLPVHVVGTSMGGAVTMKAAVGHGLDADSLILVAPAIWGWKSMNPILKSALWITAHTVPKSTATGSQLKIWPSDNIDWLREYSRDKYNIKATRFDTLYGLVSLMDDAASAAPHIKTPVLYLYGLKDEVVPAEPSFKVMQAIQAPKKLIKYDKGFHMLLHDLQREKVFADILSWTMQEQVATPVSAR